ncbi:MAG: carboxypeptidase-like regulatory domain-containing protein, partial [Vicinamibacteria bacterium]
MKTRILAALAAAMMFGSAPAWAASADGSGSLTISIRDNYGVLPGTSVRLVSKNSQTAQRAVTDASGLARFTSLAAGDYSIKASLAGFADGEKTGVTVGATEEKVELVLTLARFSTTVTVTTANRREELLMNTAEPTTVIDNVQILDTGARNAKDLLSEFRKNGLLDAKT